jgi:hypothetical protein
MKETCAAISGQFESAGELGSADSCEARSVSGLETQRQSMTRQLGSPLHEELRQLLRLRERRRRTKRHQWNLATQLGRDPRTVNKIELGSKRVCSGGGRYFAAATSPRIRRRRRARCHPTLTCSRSGLALLNQPIAWYRWWRAACARCRDSFWRQGHADAPARASRLARMERAPGSAARPTATRGRRQNHRTNKK